MEIYEGLGNLDKYNNVVMALGNFDGVHLGHRELIRRTIDIARSEEGTPAVLTFDPHPQKILHPQDFPPMLLPKEEKIRLFSELGVKLLVIAPFCESFFHLSPRQFVEEILVNRFNVRTIVVGYNYTFGHRGAGDAELLVRLGQDFGLNVIVVPPVKSDGIEVSSTAIRQLIQAGEVEEAAKMLGYRPFIVSRVVSGDRRGRQIGFPTANIHFHPELVVPANGVYAVNVRTNGGTFKGVANVGVKPTFNCQYPRNLEVHIFDFSSDIYGAKIRVEFIERIRGEKKFSSVEELVAQIQKDTADAKRLLQPASEV